MIRLLPEGLRALFAPAVAPPALALPDVLAPVLPLMPVVPVDVDPLVAPLAPVEPPL